MPEEVRAKQAEKPLITGSGKSGGNAEKSKTKAVSKAGNNRTMAACTERTFVNAGRTGYWINDIKMRCFR